MNCKTKRNAERTAKELARINNTPYAVFLSSDLQWYITPVDRMDHTAFDVYWPDGTSEHSVLETTVGELTNRHNTVTVKG